MEIHLFFNPAAAAGRSAMRLGAALATFRALGASVSLHRPDSAESARAHMKELGGDVERIVVVGGDGMVHQAANALVGTTTALGIVSAGTGNDAVTSLGLSDDIDDACRAALREPVAIDLIESQSSVAVTVATLGFSAAVTDRANEMQRIRGGAKYTISALMELPRLRAHPVTMILDGVEHETQANLIAIANTQYFGGGMKIAPDARVDDGELDVVVVGPAPRVAFASVLPTVFSGRHVRSRYVTVHRARTVELGRVHPDGPNLDVRADGEDFGALPVSLGVRNQALLVAGAVVS